MSRDKLISDLSSAGYTVKPFPKNNTGIVIYYGDGGSKNKGERVSFLRDIVAPLVGGTYKTSTPIKSSVGGVTVGSITIVTKPESDVNGSLASLDARIFSGLGKKIQYTYADETFDAVEFTDTEVIKRSLAEGIRNASMLDDSLVDSLESLYSGWGMSWSDKTDMATRNKLGVYLGEMLIGLIALGSVDAKRDYLRSNFFGTGTPAKRFILPTDPAFSGVDSFVEMKDGTLYPISSKFGVGAKASIFTNLIAKAVKTKGTLGKSVFKDLCYIVAEGNLKPTDSRAIVYAYGVREILGLDASAIKDPNKVYEQIRSGSLGTEAKLAIAAANTLKKKLPSPLTKFQPHNMSYLFNMALAERLNQDPESMSNIKEILAGKKYWQVNLDQQMWKNGKLMFGAVLSGDASVRIIGNKSPSTDITSKQGWVNYELKLTS